MAKGVFRNRREQTHVDRDVQGPCCMCMQAKCRDKVLAVEILSNPSGKHEGRASSHCRQGQNFQKSKVLWLHTIGRRQSVGVSLPCRSKHGNLQDGVEVRFEKPWYYSRETDIFVIETGLDRQVDIIVH